VKLILQILFLLLTWFTNLSATPVFTKVAIPNYVVSFSKTETATVESVVKIGVQNFARSGIEVNSFSQKGTSRVSCALVGASRAGERESLNGAGKAFTHVPTSGALITNNAKQGTFLVGSYPSDLQYILGELNYPKIQNVDFAFPVPSGQKFNLLNISDEAYNYWAANGGFFTKVNGPWIDAAVTQGADIVVVSKMETLYNSPGVLSGFGKEIHRLEWKHGYRFDPSTKMMVPPSKANGLPTKTLQSEYTHN
jgi:hypothetical protein